MQWAKQKQGFTIVELLIVIVVIAILAAISIVAYNGIQERATRSAIQSDLKGAITKIESFKATSSVSAYPAPNDTALGTVGFSATKNLYATGAPNFLYCGSASTSAAGVVAQTKSGKTYVYATNRAFGEYTANPISDYSAICTELVGTNAPRYGYTEADGWRWVQ